MSRISRAACVLLLTLPPSIFGVSASDFEKIVDFSVTLKTLASAAVGETALPSNRLFLLNGTVSEVTFLAKEKEGFRVRIRLLSGEWIGLEDVKSYACYVTFSGPEFFSVFPARASKNPAPGTIFTNTRVLVLARALGPVDLPMGGGKVMGMEGVFIRVLN